MARFNPQTGKVENSNAADQAIMMVKFMEKTAAENEARLAGLKTQQKSFKERVPVYSEQGSPTGEKMLPKGTVIGEPTTGLNVSGQVYPEAPAGSVRELIPYSDQFKDKGKGGSKDNRTVITPMQELQQTLDRISGKYETQAGFAQGEQTAATDELNKLIASAGGDINKVLSEFAAKQTPSTAYSNVQLAGPALAGESPLLAALRGQGAGTAAVDTASAQQNELARLLSSFSQQNLASEAEAAKTGMDALNALTSGYGSYVRDVALPEKQKTEQAKIDKSFADDLARFAESRALAEEAARQARVDATQKVVVPAKKTTPKPTPKPKPKPAPKPKPEIYK
jgi:hypothetical protein